MKKQITFMTISPEELGTTYKDHMFWYLFDENRNQYVISPNLNGIEPLIYVFVNKEDAEDLSYLLTKSPAYQDDRSRLKVISDVWREIDKDCAKMEGEFKWIAIAPDQAKILLDHVKMDIPLSELEEQELRELRDRIEEND